MADKRRDTERGRLLRDQKVDKKAASSDFSIHTTDKGSLDNLFITESFIRNDDNEQNVNKNGDTPPDDVERTNDTSGASHLDDKRSKSSDIGKKVDKNTNDSQNNDTDDDLTYVENSDLNFCNNQSDNSESNPLLIRAQPQNRVRSLSINRSKPVTTRKSQDQTGHQKPEGDNCQHGKGQEDDEALNDSVIVSGNIKSNHNGNQLDTNRNSGNITLATTEVASESTPKPSDSLIFTFQNTAPDQNNPTHELPLPMDKPERLSASQPSLATGNPDDIQPSRSSTAFPTEATVYIDEPPESDIPKSLRNLLFLTKPDSPTTRKPESFSVINPGFISTKVGKRSNLKKKPGTPISTLAVPTSFPAISNDGSTNSLNVIGGKKSIKWNSDIPGLRNVSHSSQDVSNSQSQPTTKEAVLNSLGQAPNFPDWKTSDNLPAEVTESMDKANRPEAVAFIEIETPKDKNGSSGRGSSGYSSPVKGFGSRDVQEHPINLKNGGDNRNGLNVMETDVDEISIGLVSSCGGGLSTPGDMTPRDYLTDNDDTVTSYFEMERKHNLGASVGDTSQEQNQYSEVFTDADVTLRKTPAAIKSTKTRLRFLPEMFRNSLVMIFSAIYGITLVVLGLVLPLSETFANPDHPYIFELFYLYLYIVSMVFLVYVYTYLLRKERLFLLNLPKTISKTFSRTFSRSSMRSRASVNSEKAARSSVISEKAARSSDISEKAARSSVNSEKAARSSVNSEKAARSSVDSEKAARTSVNSGRGRRTPSEKSVPSPSRPLIRQNSDLSSYSVKKKRKFAYIAEASKHTGSFYLRVGVIGFGIGSMIYSALNFGHYFEVNNLDNQCSNAIQAIKPLAHMCFTFVQMYFIFMNSKMCVHKYKMIARFGLMHMSCTNICVWLRAVVVETVQVIKSDQRESYLAMVLALQEQKKHSGEDSEEEKHVQTLEEFMHEHNMGYMPEIMCRWNAMLGRILDDASIYLYPCIIEYSLVCACVLYVMWSNVGEGYTPKRVELVSDVDTLDSDVESDEDSSHHKMSVDCAASSRGLFLGLLLFVANIVCVVSFYVLTSVRNHVPSGILLGHISEQITLIIAFFATAIAAYQMRHMRFAGKRKVGIEEILTLVSISGLGLYGIWSIIAAVFHLNTLHGRLTLVTNLFMIIQAGCQAMFTLRAIKASPRNHEQLREKPGRQCVTFLLMCNFALFVVSVFETQHIDYNQTQVDFYGNTAWAIFSHISVPLGIYFRFNATVNLSIIWKKAWKKTHTNSPSHG